LFCVFPALTEQTNLLDVAARRFADLKKLQQQYPQYALHWETFREGYDDIRYLVTLEESISQAKAKGINVTAAQNWLANVKEMPPQLPQPSVIAARIWIPSALKRRTILSS
jgi:hypothetical protein